MLWSLTYWGAAAPPSQPDTLIWSDYRWQWLDGSYSSFMYPTFAVYFTLLNSTVSVKCQNAFHHKYTIIPGLRHLLAWLVWVNKHLSLLCSKLCSFLRGDWWQLVKSNSWEKNHFTSMTILLNTVYMSFRSFDSLVTMVLSENTQHPLTPSINIAKWF